MKRTGRTKLTVREMTVFALFATAMYISAQIDVIPNVHPLALCIAALTAVYRAKALIPIYLYVMLEGIFGGFGIHWWPMNLYVWLFSFAFVLLIPKKTNEYIAGILITVISGLHGILFGVLCAPYQGLVLFKGNFDMTWKWMLSGLAFDINHMLGNIAFSILAIPLIKLLCRLEKKQYPYADSRKR